MNELSDKTKLLLNLIMEKKSANEIANILGISNRQLYNYLTVLKNKGFFFERKFLLRGAQVPNDGFNVAWRKYAVARLVAQLVEFVAEFFVLCNPTAHHLQCSFEAEGGVVQMCQLGFGIGTDDE